MMEKGMASGDRRFGPRGSITTEEECTAAGGEFEPGMRSWMVHVNMFLGGDEGWVHKH
jgi:hypothetical protein